MKRKVSRARLRYGFVERERTVALRPRERRDMSPEERELRGERECPRKRDS